MMKMKISVGYQQTEMGVIPKDWDLKQIGEIAIVSSGGTPNRSNPSYWNGNIPWITTSQIDFNTIIRANEFITKLGVQNSAAKLYAQNTLLMAMYGQGKTRGKVAILGIDATINQACAAITLNKDIFNNYIFFYLAHNYEEIRKLSNTGNQENLNGNIIKSIFIPIPPLPEQKAIAQSLSDVDTLITALDQVITKKRNIKQGTMQQLLTGKKCLPGFSDEWEVKKLGDYVDISSGESPSKFHFAEGGIPYFKVEQLNNSNKYQRETPYYIKYDKPVQCGSIIFPKRGASILLNKIRILAYDSFMDTNLMTLTVKNQLDNEFLFYLLCYQELWKIADTTSIPQINNKHINPFLISSPVLPEQKAIAQFLSDMDAEIEALEQKRDKYKAIKQGMMQELLTGKTRLISSS